MCVLCVCVSVCVCVWPGVEKILSITTEQRCGSSREDLVSYRLSFVKHFVKDNMKFFFSYDKRLQ